MSAYLAPAFFSYLFGKCLRRKNPLLEISKLGLAVLGTFAVIWWPYLYSTEASLEVKPNFPSLILVSCLLCNEARCSCKFFKKGIVVHAFSFTFLCMQEKKRVNIVIH